MKLETYPTGDIIKLINNYRIHNNLRPLQFNPTLSSEAYNHVMRMAKQRILMHSKLPYFENVAEGQHTDVDVFNDWKNSPKHNANMLQSKVTTCGVAAAKSDTIYWCLMLI